MLWICTKCLTCIWKEKVLQQCIFYCKFLILSEPGKLLFWQSADLDKIYLVTGASIASTINFNRFHWLSPYWLGQLFECGRRTTKFNCFNHRQADWNGGSREQHAHQSGSYGKGKKGCICLCLVLCSHLLLELLGSKPPKAPQHQHLLEHEHFNEKCSGNMLLKGKDLEQL